MARMLPLALLLLTSCATTSFFDAVGDSMEKSNGNAEHGLGIAVVVIQLTPICLALDTITFPVQYFAGYQPYGDKEAVGEWKLGQKD